MVCFHLYDVRKKAKLQGQITGCPGMEWGRGPTTKEQEGTFESHVDDLNWVGSSYMTIFVTLVELDI